MIDRTIHNWRVDVRVDNFNFNIDSVQRMNWTIEDGYISVIDSLTVDEAETLAARINAGEDIDFDSVLIQCILDEV